MLIFFFNVITNTPEMTSGEKKNFPAARSYTKDSPHPTMSMINLLTSQYLSFFFFYLAKVLLDFYFYLHFFLGEI